MIGTLLQWAISLSIAYGAFTMFTRMFPGSKDILREGQSRLSRMPQIQAARRIIRRIEMVLLLFILTTVIRAFIQWQWGWGF